VVQRSRVYRDGQLEETGFSLELISDLERDNHAFYWLDLVSPTKEQLAKLGDELQLNAFAIEDAFTGSQRPKLEHYDSHLFINAYGANFNHEKLELNTQEIAIFVTANGLITVRDDESFDVDALIKRWDESHELATNGVAFLLWGLLDQIVDGYFDVIQDLDQELEQLEDMLFSDSRKDAAIQRKSYALRKALVVLRRIAVPMREVLNPIIKRDTQVIGNSMFAYFQDIYDHVMRAADWTDSLRDLVTTLLETNLTIQGNRMNLIMKKVTSWAAIIAVPTAITGFYGQNIPYPGYAQEWGFWISSGAIVLISGGLYLAFKKNDWL
jgi:magnesium transporter